MPTSTTPPKWNLSDLYENIDDPKINQDIKKIDKLAADFAKTYRQQLTPGISASGLLAALQKYEAILRETYKIGAYAHLVFSTHTANQKHGAFLQKTRAWSTNIYNSLLFFELAILNFPEKKLKALRKNPDFAGYKHYLKKQIDQKPHRLPEDQESILNQKSLTGRQAFIRLFTQQSSTRTYHVKVGKKIKTLTETAVLDLMYSPNRANRRRANEALGQGLREASALNSFIFNILAADYADSRKLRHFKNPEAPRHLDNEVDQSTVDALVGTVTDNYQIVRDYYRFKRNLLGYKKLYEYDRYSPVSRTNKTFTYSEAKDIILKSFHDFSPQFAAIAQKFFDNNWIDAAPNTGKQGGAYCMYVTPAVHPYVFMNFSGTINDILTLAHELGHAVHGYLAREQTHLHYDWPLTLSETASVFAEMLVFQSLKKQITADKQKLSLYTSRIESMFATVFRQISMYKFEQIFHRQHAERGELPTEEINKIWRQSQQEMFGNSVTLTPDEDIRWSYIPHFVHTPFYVYAYAFGELLTLSLYSLYERRGDDFVDQYLTLLKAGGSESPPELLKPFNIDIHSPAFWQGGINEIKDLVKEAEKLAK